MGKKKKPVVECWYCKKSFKGEDAVRNHASDKGHQWRPPVTGRVAPPVLPSLQSPVSVAAPTKAQAVPITQQSLLCQPCPQCDRVFPQRYAHEFHFKYVHPYQWNATQQEGSSSSGKPVAGRLECPACDTTFKEEYLLRWHMRCENSCPECKIHHPSFLALQEHLQVCCDPSLANIAGTSPFKASDKRNEAAPGIAKASVSDSSVDIDVDVPVPVQSEHTTSSVSSVPTSTDTATAEHIERNTDFDDVESVVSYASFVEVTEADTLDPAMTSMRSSGTSRDQQASPQSYSDAESAGVLVSPRSPVFTILKEAHSSEVALQANGPPPVAERTLKPVQPSLPRVQSATPTLPNLSSSRSSDMLSPSTIVPGPLPGGDYNGAAGPSDPKHHALRPHIDQRSRAAPRASGDEATSQETTNNVNAVQRVISWHCRSCQRDPCDSPVATICGHIFCHSCISREISANGCCPICKKLFLLRLDIAV